MHLSKYVDSDWFIVPSRNSVRKQEDLYGLVQATINIHQIHEVIYDPIYTYQNRQLSHAKISFEVVTLVSSVKFF